jgi:tocopherol O-methyltransferase
VITSFGKAATGASVKNRVGRFYDVASPLYLEIYGSHIHDGYYVTGRETKDEAQENLVKFLAAKAGIKRGDRVLDVGCGVGGSSIWLAENLGAVTTGITISPVQVEIAARAARARHASASFLLMDADAMHFPHLFEFMWIVGALTHFPTQESFIKSSTPFLTEKGRIVIFDWMLKDTAAGVKNDHLLAQVAEGMLLPTMFSISSYIEWLVCAGYRIAHVEDITARTIRTWDVALATVKKPAVMRLAYRLTRDELSQAFRFLIGLRAMKQAMKKGKLISGVIIAEKTPSTAA